MKFWKIFITILFIVGLGLSAYLYYNIANLDEGFIQAGFNALYVLILTMNFGIYRVIIARQEKISMTYLLFFLLNIGLITYQWFNHEVIQDLWNVGAGMIVAFSGVALAKLANHSGHLAKIESAIILMCAITGGLIIFAVENPLLYTIGFVLLIASTFFTVFGIFKKA